MKEGLQLLVALEVQGVEKHLGHALDARKSCWATFCFGPLWSRTPRQKSRAPDDEAGVRQHTPVLGSYCFPNSSLSAGEAGADASLSVGQARAGAEADDEDFLLMGRRVEACFSAVGRWVAACFLEGGSVGRSVFFGRVGRAARWVKAVWRPRWVSAEPGGWVGGSTHLPADPP